MQKDNLILVDGSAYLYRAYHAMPALSSPTGAPTGAIYGVANMLKRLLKDYADTADIIVVFDPKGPTTRNIIYPEYKANRSAMPDELREQIQPLHTLIKALGIPIFIKEQEEADDVIGTFAKLGVTLGYKVIISSADKDFCQLVNNDIKLMNTMSNVTFDMDGVIAKFGVRPDQIIDYLALVGDSSDNIPGINKVGPKTASSWLQKYDTIEGVMAQDLTGVGFRNLKEQEGQLPLAKTLVTINTELDITTNDLHELLQIEPDKLKQQQLFQELGFKNWLKELGSAEEEITTKYSIVEDYEQLKHELQAHDVIAINLMFEGSEVLGIAFTAKESYYLPLSSCPNAFAELEDIFENKIIVAHDIKAIYKAFNNLKGKWFDTMLLSYVLNSSAGRHNFDLVVARYLDITPPSYDALVHTDLAQYATARSEINLKLYHVLIAKLREDGLEHVYLELEQPLIKILADMEEAGILLDTRRLSEQGSRIATEISKLEQEVYLIAGEEFNIASTKQLRAILFEKLQLPVLKKTPKKQAATSEEVLSILSKDFEIAQKLLSYRSLTKLKSTYIDKLPQDIRPSTGRVHCSYNQAVTATGRLSSNDPNLQNIPIKSAEGRLIRKAFIASEGKLLLAADYSQVELRIMAHLSGDKALCEAFAQHLDVHGATAAEIFNISLGSVTSEHRRKAKAINFGLMYGMSSFGLAKQLGLPRAESQQYIDRYFERYVGVKHYMDSTRAQALDNGYVTTIFGRKLYLQGIKDRNPMVRKAAERAAINAPLQGSAADIIKLAMIRVAGSLSKSNIDATLLLQVHDELVFEVVEQDLAELTAMVEEAMAKVCDLKVPLEVIFGSGLSWDEAH